MFLEQILRARADDEELCDFIRIDENEGDKDRSYCYEQLDSCVSKLL